MRVGSWPPVGGEFNDGGCSIRSLLVALVAMLVLPFGASPAFAGCQTKRCELRVAKKQEIRSHGIPWCRGTYRCVRRYYARHPMPACTWVGESGGSWTAKNPSSTAGGKYQIIDGTWYRHGGSVYRVRHPAAAAPPLEQEKIARRVLRVQGLGAWVLC